MCSAASQISGAYRNANRSQIETMHHVDRGNIRLGNCGDSVRQPIGGWGGIRLLSGYSGITGEFNDGSQCAAWLAGESG